jgi:hypothetical protein
LRLAFRLGLVAGVAYAVAKVLEAQRTADDAPAPRPAPSPAAPPAVAKPPAWVEPVDGACPVGHPVKAKLSSKIFHLPGMAMYDRTRPDRCYAGAAEAEADGLRPAKR